MKRSVDSHRGIGRAGLFVLLFLVAAGVYSANQILPFYYYYWEIEGLMGMQARKASEFSDDEIRKTILQRIKELEVPINDPSDLKINRFNRKIVIDLKYYEVLTVSWGEKERDLWVFPFNPHVEVDY